MVFPDLSAPESVPNTNSEVRYPLASPLDRLSAFVLDFLIFYPVVSFLLAGLSQQIKRIFLSSPNSAEGLTAFILIFVAASMIIVLLQTLFLLTLRATPGMLFLQLRVRDFHSSDAPLNFYQSFLRSMGWVVSAWFCGAPFLEVLGHPLRRHIADRVSDTLVITLKKNYDRGPAYQTTALIQSCMKFILVFSLFNGMLIYTSSYKKFVATSRADSQTTDIASSCMDVDTDSKFSTLDRAVTLYLIDGLSSDCLNYEADVVLWGNKLENNALAYFAKYLTSAKEERAKYSEKICADGNQVVCEMVKYIESPTKAPDLIAESEEWASLWYLRSEQAYSQGKFLVSLEGLQKLMVEKDFERSLDRKYARGIWALQNNSVEGRQPASDVKSMVDEFKERFDIP